MGSVEGDGEGQVQDGIVGGQIIGPQKALLPKFDGGRKKIKKRDQNGKLQKHGQATAQRIDARFLE